MRKVFFAMLLSVIGLSTVSASVNQSAEKDCCYPGSPCCESGCCK